MIEEVSMDKKTTNRSVQAPLKGNGTELKKPQDAQTNGKQIPRGCRKREPSASNGFKFDQNRKPAPQKSKAIDKRPQSRGFYNGSGKENTQVKDVQEEGEVGSLFSGGRKKQNLNHLLNFHYEPRGEAFQAARKTYIRNYSTKSLMATQTHKYNKEQFLQANCQFIVRYGEDYTPYMADPDILVNWDLVELIRVWSNEVVTCPICLYPPVAAKITRCGHVFCWSCILHYLALSDKTWRKCPICYEAVHKNNLKSVQCIENTVWNVGQKIQLRLMKREKGSVIASPVAQYEPRSLKPLLHISEETLDTVYSKLLLANTNDVTEILEKEKSELDAQLEECRGCPELCFVEQAVDLLMQRKIKLEEHNESEFKPKKIETESEASLQATESAEQAQFLDDTNECVLSTKVTQDGDLSQNRERYESLSSEGEENTNVTAEDLYIGNNQTNNQPIKYFYFYQAIDGQQIYLHAINVRMLEMNYGSLENSPPTIMGAIIEKESGSMTSELRKRLRYLQHVPITCQFEVVEISLAPPTISKDVLNSFHEQLDQRKHIRAKRARAERRREKKIEVEMFGHFRNPKLRIESLHHFPQCGVDLPPPISPQVESQESSRASSPIALRQRASPFSCAMAALSVEDSVVSGSPSEDSVGPSFAQMLREGKTMKACGTGWPTVGDGGKPMGASYPSRQHHSSLSLTESDSEAAIALSPPAKPSFNIAEALQNASIYGPLETNAGKKKKKKQKVLFSTGMACTGK